jgi:fructose-1,6-bisphosphatase/inositol monophosphatase family enzyme
MAAGLLFVKESGGFVRSLTGSEDVLNSGGFLATNADLLPLMQAALAEAAAIN